MSKTRLFKAKGLASGASAKLKRCQHGPASDGKGKNIVELSDSTINGLLSLATGK
jgi:hypothetical protein